MRSRWWIYQRERFPLATHVPFSLVLGAAALGWSTQQGGRPPASLLAIAAAGATALLFFLQLRVADEFKDLEDDRRFRPERPVPRGLIKLRELAALAVAAAIVQIVLAVTVAPILLGTLVALWTYAGLMSVEFFAPRWLKRRPLAYMLSHMVVVVFLMVHLTAFDWLRAGAAPQPTLAIFAGFAFFVGLTIELGRKTWSPQQQRPGVETYTGVWGVPRATAGWACAATTACAFAVWAADHVGARITNFIVAVLCILVAVALAWAFMRRPTPRGSKLIEAHSALTAFALYVAVGLVPRYLGGVV